MSDNENDVPHRIDTSDALQIMVQYHNGYAMVGNMRPVKFQWL